ncbi:MAG: serine hydrolase [Clostridiales bacterium]|nr:serine hydrolase [Clostridiales bacterium]
MTNTPKKRSSGSGNRPVRSTARADRTRTNKKRRRRRRVRFRRLRRNPIRSTISLILALAVVCVLGSGIIYLIRDGIFSDPVLAYASSAEFESTLTSRENNRADSLAADLCVVQGEVTVDALNLESGQEGLLLSLEDQEVLFAVGAYERIYPASITKIMTALVALKYGNMEDVVTITAEDVALDSDSQRVGFVEGDQVTMDVLVHSLLVYSGNDAALAIARHVGGSTTEFVAMMNSYAASLGCTGTNFVNPHGLHDDNHYTTAYDIYLMLNEALNYTEFTDITQLSSYTAVYTASDGTETSVVLTATDQYLTGESTPPKNVTILGGKTGTTSAAGNCLAILVQNEYARPYVSIILGAGSKELLYQQMNILLGYINV